MPESSHARKMVVSKGMVGKKRWKFVAAINLKSLVVVHEREPAINLALYGVL